MITSAKYNGINFSPDFNRSGENYDYNGQRVKNILPSASWGYISFNVTDVVSATTAKMKVIYKSGAIEILDAQRITESLGGAVYNFYFRFIAADLTVDEVVYFAFTIDGSTIYSEIYEIKSTAYLLQNEIIHIDAYNADNRHGYLTNQAFGYFKSAKFKTDFFLNKTTEYNYSYSRKKILASENQKGKRFTFFDLTMYNANLLQWLCRCENLSIDGVQYQLISDFTEINNDPNSEIMSLQADFVEVNQSFFANGATNSPLNIFTNSFFN